MDHLIPVDESLGPHMQSRILLHLNEAFGLRQQRWVEQLGRDVRMLHDPASFGSALNEAKRRLRPLATLVRSPLLGERERVAFSTQLTDTVTAVEQQLDRQVRSDPTSERHLLGMLRAASLRSGLVTPPSPGTGPTLVAQTLPSRRIML